MNGYKRKQREAHVYDYSGSYEGNQEPFVGECGGREGHNFVWQEHLEMSNFNLDATNNQKRFQENAEAEQAMILCDR